VTKIADSPGPTTTYPAIANSPEAARNIATPLHHRRATRNSAGNAGYSLTHAASANGTAIQAGRPRAAPNVAAATARTTHASHCPPAIAAHAGQNPLQVARRTSHGHDHDLSPKPRDTMMKAPVGRARSTNTPAAQLAVTIHASRLQVSRQSVITPVSDHAPP
jgi:hypothetical protein